MASPLSLEVLRSPEKLGKAVDLARLKGWTYAMLFEEAKRLLPDLDLLEWETMMAEADDV